MYRKHWPHTATSQRAAPPSTALPHAVAIPKQKRAKLKMDLSQLESSTFDLDHTLKESSADHMMHEVGQRYTTNRSKHLVCMRAPLYKSCIRERPLAASRCVSGRG
eukprot:6180454-Pleurochrysis_carterae.AAC.1